MGTPKISDKNAEIAVKILKTWSAKDPLTWEAFRLRLGPKLPRSIKRAWSRQALSSHEKISTAFTEAKIRIAESSKPTTARRSQSYYVKRVQNLELQLEDALKKLKNLKLRHTQLAYNASLLPGGTRLLLDSLP